MKFCGKCKTDKPLEDFYRNKRGSQGRMHHCILCVKEYKDRNYDKFTAARKKCYDKNRENRVAYMVEWHSSINGRARRLHESAKRRAEKRGLSFTIPLAQVYVLLFIGKCQRSGIKFDLLNRKDTVMNPFAPSLDRIDNFRGYEPDNIQMVCNLYNMGKGQNTDEEFLQFCEIVTEYNRRMDNAAQL